MIKLKELYKPKHKDDKERREKTEAEIIKHREELRKIGQACMGDPKFLKYKETFQAMERLTFDQARHYRNPDPIQYAHVISNMFSELNTFEALIEDIESDGRKVS